MTTKASTARSVEAGPGEHNMLFTITGGRGGASIDSLRELWVFREVFAAFIVRRIKVRYKQALFGVAWVVIQPLASAAVLAFFLGRLVRLPSDGAPYFLFVLTGLTLWAYFAQTIAASIESLVVDAGVLRKVYFPREMPPLSLAVAGLVDLGVGFVILLSAALISGFRPNLFWLLLPLPALVIIVLAAGVGLLLSGLNVYYRDISYGLPFLIQVGLFASPIIYSTSLVPNAVRPYYEIFNPIAAGVQSLRDIILGQRAPDFAILGAAFLWSLVIAVAAYELFKLIERPFADYV